MFFSPLTCKSNPVTSVFSPLPLVFNKVCACKKGKNMRSDGFDKTAATLQGLNIAVSCDDTKRYFQSKSANCSRISFCFFSESVCPLRSSHSFEAVCSEQQYQFRPKRRIFCCLYLHRKPIKVDTGKLCINDAVIHLQLHIKLDQWSCR